MRAQAPAGRPPIVVLTSNRAREIHDTVKRRSLYRWVGFFDAAREAAILARRVPGTPQTLAAAVVAFVQRLRAVELYKQPDIAETIEWTRALMELNAIQPDPEIVNDTWGVLLNYQGDIAKVQGSDAARVLQQLRSEAQTQNAGLPLPRPLRDRAKRPVRRAVTRAQAGR